MHPVPTILASRICVDSNLLGQNIVDQIFNELTVENKAKIVAKRMKRWGWEDLPDEFILVELDGDTIIMPRGYAFQYKLLLRENGMTPFWIDKRTWKRGSQIKWRKKFIPRKHQPLAKKKLKYHEQGIYEAPTGSGKSLTCIWLIQDLSPKQSIVLVDQLNLLTQWQKDISDWLEVDCGIIGNGKWNEDTRVVVATVQSIWSAIKRGNVDESFFKRFSLVIADECHHTSADSIREIVGRFSARYRAGVSATPDRLDDKFEITQAVLGEIVHQDNEEELRTDGVLVRPHVEVIRTNFEFDYWPSHESDEDHHCLVPRCKLHGIRHHSHQDNYQKLKDAIVSDEQRNKLIAKTIWKQTKIGDHHHLVITDEVRHLEAIYMELCGVYSHNKGLPGLRILTGKVKGKDRSKLIKEIKSATSSVTLATVAKEGVDIPVVDRLYLPFPSSNVKAVQQRIGRGTRVAEGKDDSIIFDFQDINVQLLKKQFKKRADQCYRKLGIEVKL
jgi:superfamily II DNA or RNA helicase